MHERIDHERIQIIGICAQLFDYSYLLEPHKKPFNCTLIVDKVQIEKTRNEMNTQLLWHKDRRRKTQIEKN